MASLGNTTTPPRRTLRSKYACAACNGEGVLDEGRYRELTETPGPLFLPVSQRPTMDEPDTLPYVMTVTSKNAKRERERRRQQENETVGGKGSDGRDRAKRRRSARHSDVAESRDDIGPDEAWDEDQFIEGVVSRVGDQSNDTIDQTDHRDVDRTDVQVDNRSNNHIDDQVNDQNDDPKNDNVETNEDEDENSNDEVTIPQPCSPSSGPAVFAQPPPSPSHEEEEPRSTTLSAPTSTPAEEIGMGSVRSDRAEAEALLKLGLGKDEAISATGGKILDVVFAVAGPAAMEDILGLCHRWREGLIVQSRQDVDRKTAELRAEWGGRLPDGDQKSAIVAVHVSAYWALSDDNDDFVRSVIRRGRLADFFDAFDELLRPKTKPNAGWKKKHADVMKSRLTEAHPGLDPEGEDYRRKKARFKRQLQFGERWARLRREFGGGIFALLPSLMVTNKWIEQALSAAQFDAWLNVLGRHNRPDPEVVKRVGQLVEEVLGGSQPPTQLRLEAASRADVAREYRSLTLLQPLEDAQSEDALFTSDGAFLDEVNVT